MRRVNLFPSPLFTNYQKSAEASTDVEVSDGAITVTGANTDKSYVQWHLSGLEPGALMLFRCRCEPLGEWPDSNHIVWLYRSDWKTAGGIKKQNVVDGVGLCEFNVPDDGVVGVRFVALNGTRFSEPQLETKSTFDENLPFFYYGTMPIES